ncbi:MAG: glycosyltransferase [Anaerolineales bacterium]
MIHDLIRVSVVIPTLNEAKNIPLIFPHIPLGVVDEVILVDGRSTDGTVEVARRLMPSVKVVLEPTPGKGAALRAGYRAATGDIIVVVDADGSNDPREIPRYLRSLIEGADFAKGSRFAHRGGTTDMPRVRQAGNRVFVTLVNLLFSASFTDLCYGYHGFWRYCLDVIDIEQVDGFEIDTALYVRAVRERLRIVEVPSFEGYRFYGEGKLRTIPDGLRVLGTIIHEWTNALVAPRRQADYLGFRGQLGSAMVDNSLTGPSPAAATALQAPAAAPAWPAAGGDTKRIDLQLLLAISRALAVHSSLRDLLQQVLRLTLERIDASSGSVMVLNENGEVVDGCLSYAGAIGPLPFHGHSEIVEQGMAGWVVRNRKPVLITSTRHDVRWLTRAWEENEGKSRSAVVVPLFAGDRVIGVLTLVRQETEPFSEADLELVSAMGASL